MFHGERLEELELRKLLIKLVAVETILVGWLSYWIFLVYANNPSVAAELASSLQRFPQLSFSTIDIAVMVIIAALAVTLAFKFQRGLRPGIRLERALQMLENLMKRNLVLEAQVAELKIEKTHPQPIITSVPTPPPTPEPKEGTWEKAFRTPLEAGPSVSPKASSANDDDIPFGRRTGIPPPRIEPKSQQSAATIKPSIMITEKSAELEAPPTLLVPEKPVEKPSFQGTQRSASSWEDSPQFIGESKGILTPSAPPRRAPTVSDSGGLRQPYIPAPAPRSIPPSVVVGPIASQSPPRLSPPSIPPKITARPTPRSSLSKTSPPPSPIPALTEAPKPSLDIPPLNLTPSPPVPDKPATLELPASAPEVLLPKPTEQNDKAEEKTSSKTVQSTRKKPSSDES